MLKQNILLLNGLLTLLLMTCISHSLANPVMLEDPIYIQSKTAYFNDHNNTITYEGQVILEQKNNRLLCDKIFIKMQNKKIATIIATGNLAHFEITEKGPKKKIAKAKTIRYFPAVGKLELEGKAIFIAENKQIEGSYLIYFLNSKVLTAHSIKNEQAIITFNPKKILDTSK